MEATSQAGIIHIATYVSKSSRLILIPIALSSLMIIACFGI